MIETAITSLKIQIKITKLKDHVFYSPLYSPIKIVLGQERCCHIMFPLC